MGDKWHRCSRWNVNGMPCPFMEGTDSLETADPPPVAHGARAPKKDLPRRASARAAEPLHDKITESTETQPTHLQGVDAWSNPAVKEAIRYLTQNRKGSSLWSSPPLTGSAPLSGDVGPRARDVGTRSWQEEITSPLAPRVTPQRITAEPGVGDDKMSWQQWTSRAALATAAGALLGYGIRSLAASQGISGPLVTEFQARAEQIVSDRIRGTGASPTGGGSTRSSRRGGRGFMVNTAAELRKRFEGVGSRSYAEPFNYE